MWLAIPPGLTLFAVGVVLLVAALSSAGDLLTGDRVESGSGPRSLPWPTGRLVPLGVLAFLAGPPMIGVLSEALGLPIALLAVVAFGVMIALGARIALGGRESEDPADRRERDQADALHAVPASSRCASAAPAAAGASGSNERSSSISAHEPEVQ